MRKLKFNYRASLKFSEDIYEHLFQLRCYIPDNLYQKVEEINIKIEPNDAYALCKDSFGNTLISGQANNPHNTFDFEIDGIVNVEYQQLYKEECHPLYRFETPLTKYDASMFSLLPGSNNFFEAMMDLSRKIYYEIYYTPKATSISTTAKEAFEMKKGVCQDFAHIMLAVVRHMGYSARYVVGMMQGEGATHAWVEVYYNGVWHGFDPTNNRPVNNQYIVIAKGRDYSDCAIDKGTFKADKYAYQEMDVHVLVKAV